VKIMSNDLLPLPDILAEPPNATDRAGIAAGIAATTEVFMATEVFIATEVLATGEALVPADVLAAVPAAERNGHVLTEYPSRDPHPQTSGIVGSVNGLNALTPGDSLLPVATPLADGLADVAVTIRQIESILQADGPLAPEVHFAVERIHDVAMALRMRDIEGALCDTLEASIREVGDAVVRHDAAAARALSATALLCDLSRRIDQMVAHAPIVAVGTPSADRLASSETIGDGTRHANGAAHQPMAGPVDGFVSDDDHARSLLQPAFVHPALPEMQAAVEAKDHPDERSESVMLAIPSPVDANNDTAAADRPDVEPRAHNQHADLPTSIAEADSPANIAEVATASELIPGEAVASAFTASANGQAEPSAAAMSIPPAADMDAVPPANSRRSPNDPLAALYGLSEEELIALFS
jgi:hypothetical protein